MSNVEWGIVIFFALFFVSFGVGLKSCGAGLDRGYWMGCAEGSDAKRQTVVVDGQKRCLPHEQAIKARKGTP